MIWVKSFIFLSIFFSVLKADKYTTKWDNIDVDSILASDRLLENYVKCLLEEGKCTPEGSELKKNIPDALKTECSKCSEKQRTHTERVVNFLMDKRKQWWEQLQNKYDPTGIYQKRRQNLRKKILTEGRSLSKEN